MRYDVNIPASSDKAKDGSIIELPEPDHFVDHVQFWSEQKLTKRQCQVLASKCQGGVYVEDAPMEFNPRFRQRIQLKQPTQEAFEYLDEIVLRRYLINMVELASDSGFPSTQERDDVFALIDPNLVRKYRRKVFNVYRYTTEARTRYDRPPGKTGLALYVADHCKVTGVLNVIHFEWRAKNAASCRKIGIKTFKDLIAFDHEAFWTKMFDRLTVNVVDLERFGRLHRNRVERRRDKNPSPNVMMMGKEVNVDLRTGRLLARLACHEWNLRATTDDMIKWFGASTIKQVTTVYGLKQGVKNCYVGSMR